MKRLILALIISIGIGSSEPACAISFSAKKTEITQNLEYKANIKAIKKTLLLQEKFVSKYDNKGLSSLYHEDFVTTDGFKKDVYFKLIEETWKSYPDIVYSSEIKDIKINGSSAQVDVFETSLATSTQIEEGLTVYGELKSFSNGTYYLQKFNNKWLFTGEKIHDEKSFLKYGDTRFVEMDLISPETAKPGETYKASLKIDKPEDAFIIASITHDPITYPQNKMEEVFRNLPSDNILERIFIANKDGKNEYNIASIGMSKSKAYSIDKVQVYLAGIAFIMKRVNIEGENAKEN